MHSHIDRRFLFIAIPLLLCTASASNLKLPREIETCSSAQACIAVLDKVVPRNSDGSDTGGKVLAAKLKRFGDPAKRELLKRAVSGHCGWRNLAGAILMYWGEWSPSDVPELRAGLRKDHGGWLARPLADIGTTEAIQALVEDLPYGRDNQTYGALSRLGAKAIPYLFPLLEQTKSSDSAARVIRDMGNDAVPFASKWASLAADPRQPQEARIAGLKGLQAIGGAARRACEPLHGLINDQNTTLRTQAMATLKAVHDPVVASEVARSCRPSADPYESLAMQAHFCLSDLAQFGVDAGEVGAQLLPFLLSHNAAERADAITTLGMIGYEPAVPEILEALHSQDWREVYAAIRSLGWLGAKRSVPELIRVSREHWLPEVRERAARVVSALNSAEGRVKRPQRFGYLEPGLEQFSPDHMILRKEPVCSSGRWQWKETPFAAPRRRNTNRDTSLALADGKLEGTNRGEWGGELSWHSAVGGTTVLREHNVVAMETDADGAMVLFGLSHMGFVDGYVLDLRRSPDGQWQLKEVARLPADADGLTSIGTGLFAAWSSGRVVVFSSSGIQGLATCVPH